MARTVTRGFASRVRDLRLPPGQYDVGADWPVLTAEATPTISTADWRFAIDGAVTTPTTWTWDQIQSLPTSTYEGDIHCVTSWSKLAMSFTGVSIDTLLAAATPLHSATHVLAASHTGYTTNLELADVTGGRAWLVWQVDGRPLPVDHGGPAGFWSRTCTCGRARNGSQAFDFSTTTNRDSGSATATTTGVTRGSNSDIRVTERPTSSTDAAVWQLATVVGIVEETPRAKTFRLQLAGPRVHLAGQHYVVRLTAPNGYTASRSYSVASPPTDTGYIELTVERLDGGEVSTFLHDIVELGDKLEVRGPIGGWFVWDGLSPALLVGGGSGVVPLMAMLRLARHTDRAELVRLVVSVRAPRNLYYAEELPGPEVTV